jgi:replicative DNA helicase
MQTNTTPAQMVLNLTHPTAETTVLMAMRRGTDDAVFMAEQLQAVDFADPRHRVTFQAIVNLLAGIEPIDDTAILAECRNVARDMRLDVRIDGGWLSGLDGDPLRARAYAVTVKRMAWLRGAGEYAYWLVKALQDLPDPERLFTEAQERMQALQPPTKTKRFVYGWETVQTHQGQIDKRIADKAAGVVNPFLWPWASWNNVFRPLRAGMVGVIAAPDGMGKSTYLECIAEHWAKGGLHVVYVHLEDELEYKLDRRLARWARVPMQAIEDGELTGEQLAKVRAAQREIDTRCTTLHYYAAPGLSMGEIVRELEAKVAEGVCQVVVLDYLEKVQPSRAQAKLFGDNLWARQGADVEGLKIFAERHHVPVLTAAQGNKSMQGDGLKTRQSISGSGQKSQLAQFVVILTREIAPKGGQFDDFGVKIADEGEYSPMVDVRVDKQNRGKTGATLRQFLVGQFFDVRDMPSKGGAK